MISYSRKALENFSKVLLDAAKTLEEETDKLPQGTSTDYINYCRGKASGLREAAIATELYAVVADALAATVADERSRLG